MSDKIKKLIKELEKIEGISNKLEYYKTNYYLEYNQDVNELAKALSCDRFRTP